MKKRKNLFNPIVISNLIICSILILFSLLTINYNFKNVFSQNRKLAIYNGNKNSNNVTLMINVYWGTEYLNDILQIFKMNKIKTTFFVGGQWVEKHPEMLKKIYNDGHEIGNHGYFHQNHNKLNYEQNREEISVCEVLVKQIINYKMNLFAPPSGAYNNTTLEVANNLGYKTIMWSKDTIDWRDKDENLVFKRATKNVCGGDFILMHPTQHTLKALPNIIDFYNKNNLKITTVTKNLSNN